MHILLIEDTLALAQTVVRYFANEDIACTLRTDGQEGYQEAVSGNYDVIILDIELPTMNGIDICRKLREAGKNTPIIMLTSRGTQEDIVRGLDCGADDYMSKPADYRELIARVHALTRRDHTHKSTGKITLGALSIDQAERSVRYHDQMIELSKREFELLLYFATHHDRLITKSELAEKIWGVYDAWEDQKVVEVYIGYLRRKIDKGIIDTQKGYGYTLGKSID